MRDDLENTHRLVITRIVVASIIYIYRDHVPTPPPGAGRGGEASYLHR